MKLYAICDMEVLDKEKVKIEKFVEIAYKYNAKMLQYRDKNNHISIKKRNILYLRKIWNRILIINDDAELIEYCDGLHVGQKDILTLSKRLGKEKREIVDNFRKNGKIVGLSTHNKEEVLEANLFNFSYIGLGAYRQSNTKKVEKVLGEEIDKIAKFSNKSVAAIGGVKLNDKFKNIEYLAICGDLIKKIKE